MIYHHSPSNLPFHILILFFLKYKQRESNPNPRRMERVLSESKKIKSKRTQTKKKENDFFKNLYVILAYPFYSNSSKCLRSLVAWSMIADPFFLKKKLTIVASLARANLRMPSSHTSPPCMATMAFFKFPDLIYFGTIYRFGPNLPILNTVAVRNFLNISGV